MKSVPPYGGSGALRCEVLDLVHGGHGFRHFRAGLGAGAARLGAVGVAHLFTGLGASSANRRARLTKRAVDGRMAQHRVLGGVANRRAVQHDADVPGVRVLAAFFQAVVDFVQAEVVGIGAVVGSLVHFRRLVFVDVGHRSRFPFDGLFFRALDSPNFKPLRPARGGL